MPSSDVHFVSRARAIAMYDLVAFTGISVRYNAVKIHRGYRADFTLV
jgi:hypothetical protein